MSPSRPAALDTLMALRVPASGSSKRESAAESTVLLELSSSESAATPTRETLPPPAKQSLAPPTACWRSANNPAKAGERPAALICAAPGPRPEVWPGRISHPRREQSKAAEREPSRPAHRQNRDSGGGVYLSTSMTGEPILGAPLSATSASSPGPVRASHLVCRAGSAWPSPMATFRWSEPARSAWVGQFRPRACPSFDRAGGWVRRPDRSQVCVAILVKVSS